MRGKVTVELEYHLNEDESLIIFSHPDLHHTMTLPYPGERLAQVQLDAINLNRPKTPLQEIIADGQELLRAAQELRDVAKTLRGK